MTTEEFRAAVFGLLQTWSAANYPAIPLIYENGPVPDEDKIGPIWIDVELRWYGAHNLSIGNPAHGRHSGAISVNVFYRDSAGTGLPGAVIDSLLALLTTQRLSSAMISFPQRTVPTNLKGWYKTGALAPFTLDT